MSAPQLEHTVLDVLHRVSNSAADRPPTKAAAEIEALRSITTALTPADLPGSKVGLLEAVGSQRGIDVLVPYLFKRKNALSEWQSSLIGGNAHGAPDSSDAEAEAARNEGTMMRDLNCEVERQIEWLMARPFTKPQFDALQSVYTEVRDVPAIRRDVLVHSLKWLVCFNWVVPEPTPIVESAVVLDWIFGGLTDVWSAIRSKCAARLSEILTRMQLSHVETLYAKLVTTCATARSLWQAKDGALLGMVTIIRAFNWDTAGSASPRKSRNTKQSIGTRSAFQMKFGDTDLDCLPAFITDGFRSVAFQMLAHPQLSIRETTTKAFSAYLSRSQFRESLVSLKDIVNRLRGNASTGSAFKDAAAAAAAAAAAEPPPLTANFIGAYAAEGLLGVCVFIIKHIPPGFLLPNWPLYYHTFELYLTHPASTVRQATSVVFRYLVAKDSGNPIILKLVLQGLASGWPVQASALKTACTPDHEEQQAATKFASHGGSGSGSGTRKQLPSIERLPDDASGPSDTWEWREGRLLAYELIFKYLLCNHVHYEYPTVVLGNRYFDEDPAALGNSTHPVDRRMQWKKGNQANSGPVTSPTQDGKRHSNPFLHASKSEDNHGELSVTSDGLLTYPSTDPSRPQTSDGIRGSEALNARGISRGSNLKVPVHGHVRTQSEKDAIKFSSVSSSGGTRGLEGLNVRGISRGSNLKVPVQGHVRTQSEKGAIKLNDVASTVAANSSTHTEPLPRLRPTGHDKSKSPLSPLSMLRVSPTAADTGKKLWHPVLRKGLNIDPALSPRLVRRDSMLRRHIERTNQVQPNLPLRHQPFRQRASTLPNLSLSLLAGVVSSDRDNANLGSPDQLENTTEFIFDQAGPALSWLEFEQSLTSPWSESIQTDDVMGTAANAATGDDANGRGATPPRRQAFPKTLRSPGWVNEKIESPPWVDTSLFRPLESVLVHIFAQTVECLASQKFELRRIASMVLPLLTEVMQWAYPVALESIYSAAMPLQSSWIALASSTSLRHSMNLILRMTHWFGLSRELDSPVQSPSDRSNRMDARILASVKDLLPHILASATAPFTNAQTEVSIEILALLCCKFRKSCDDPAALEHLFLSGLVKLFIAARGYDLLAADNDRLQQLRIAGAMCTLRRDEADRKTSKLNGRISAYLVELADVGDLTTMFHALPMLIYYPLSAGVDDAVAKHFMETLHRLFDRAGYLSLSARIDPAAGLPSDVLLQNSCALVSRAMLRPGLEKVVLRRALPVLRTVWMSSCSPTLWVEILTLIAAKVPEQLDSRQVGCDQKPSAILMLTPDKHQANPMTLYEDQDESEEEDETDVMMRASRSPRVPSRKSCDISSADSDSSSDWDSSSDDGDDSDDLAVEMLASLVHDLMSICEDPGVVARCGVESAASGKLFFAILERADVKTRKVVRWLLSSM